MASKSFSFPFEKYIVNARALLYPDGNLMAVELEAIWADGEDLLDLWKHWPEPKYNLVEIGIGMLCDDIMKAAARHAQGVLKDTCCDFSH